MTSGANTDLESTEAVRSVDFSSQDAMHVATPRPDLDEIVPKALEAKVAQEGILLTEVQIAVLERPKPTSKGAEGHHAELN
jgi:hypothetical protein